MTVLEINAAKTVLHEVAEHAYSLAMGLQNAAPPNVSQKSGSVQYLLETSMQLEKTSRDLGELLSQIDSRKGFGL